MTLISFFRRALSLRAAALLLTLGIIFSLFVLGAQPVALDLVSPPWDKLLHGCIFALLAWGIGLASGMQGCRRVAIAFVGALLVGMLDEWHQLYLPGRQAEWADLAADAVGGLVGAALATMERITHFEQTSSS
ncbi:MAG: VanZ family protein [Nitrosospira sp.]|nr:VanZ family protein [Nitrosospira sp.]